MPPESTQKNQPVADPPSASRIVLVIFPAIVLSLRIFVRDCENEYENDPEAGFSSAPAPVSPLHHLAALAITLSFTLTLTFTLIQTRLPGPRGACWLGAA